MKRLVLRAPAKINLFLEVLGKREDGYHEIRTVMHPVSLADEIEFRVARGVKIEGDTADLGEEDLIVRAARALSAFARRTLGIRASVRKRIPRGAGLGGGSSNAAATLSAMNRLHRLGLTVEELRGIGARLGSDVPFFIGEEGPRTALCSGRGERVAPLVDARGFHFVLVNPGIEISTPHVYRSLKLALTPRIKDATQFVKTWSEGTVQEIAGALFNRLERAAFELAPRLRSLKKRVAAMTASGALMSGSGSTLFAICRDASHARSVAAKLAGETRWVRAVRTERPGI